VNLVNPKVRFEGTARNNPAVVMDYFPPLGDGEGYTGLEMLLISLSGCSGTAVKALLQKMNKRVNGLVIEASGIRQETAPWAFRRIDLRFVLTSTDAEEADLMKVVALAEASVCPVWSMLKGNVEIVCQHQVVHG
jgi:putative redox protein